jgi:hypothetical protein
MCVPAEISDNKSRSRLPQSTLTFFVSNKTGDLAEKALW